MSDRKILMDSGGSMPKLKTPEELVNRPLKVYLAGPIQDTNDGGVEWRRRLTSFLTNLNIEVLDPTIYEAKELGDPVSVKDMIEECVRNEDWEKFDHYVDLLIDRDVRLVRESDFVIALMKPNVKSTGTICEIWEAVLHSQVPVYVVSYDPLSEWSYWILRVVRRHGKIFRSWNDLMEFLESTYGKRLVGVDKQ